METKSPQCGYSSLSSVKEKNHSVRNGVDGLELSQLEVGDHGHETTCKEVLLDELKVFSFIELCYFRSIRIGI